MVGIIYKTTNLLNGKIYIGSDTKNHGIGDPEYLGSGSLIIKAVVKYGRNNFIKETIHECRTLNELKELESYYIKKHDSNNRKVGYNISDGYWGGNTLSNHPEIEFIREKISNNTKKNLVKMKEARKRYFSEETEDQRLKRISAVIEGMKSMNKSFLSNPSYRENVSNGIKNSSKFADYNKRRSGAKRGRYSMNANLYVEKRKSDILKIQSPVLRKILDELVEKDHSTFYCYLKVYLHIEGTQKIEGLDLFIDYLESSIYNGKMNHIDIKNKYNEFGLASMKLGKSMTVLKSLYLFNTINRSRIIINPVKRF